MRRTAPCSRSKLLPSHDFNLFILILVSIVDHTSLCDFTIIVISTSRPNRPFAFLLEVIEPRAKTKRSVSASPASSRSASIVLVILVEWICWELGGSSGDGVLGGLGRGGRMPCLRSVLLLEQKYT